MPLKKIAMPLSTPVVNKNSFYCVSPECGGTGFLYCESSGKTVDTYSRSGDCCVTEPRQLASTADIIARCNSNPRPLADVRIVTSCKSGGRAISCSVRIRFCYLMLREQFLRLQYVFSKIS